MRASFVHCAKASPARGTSERSYETSYGTSVSSTYNARMRTLMSQGFAENGAVVAKPSTPVAA